MSYNYFQTNPEGYVPEHNVVGTKTIFAVPPNLLYLHQVLIAYLHDLAFYLIKLKELGIANHKIKEHIIDVISSIIINVDYSHEQIETMLRRIYSDFQQAKDLYISVCKTNSLKAGFLKTNLKNPQKLNFSDIIGFGEKITRTQIEKFSTEQKNLLEILFAILKSICIYLIELRELEIDDDDAFSFLLSQLLIINSYEISEDKFKEEIQKAVELDHSMSVELYKAKEERYGQITSTEVSRSINANKAILVSGTNLRELELLLEATQGKGIDIYTHGHMLTAHSYPQLQKYPHLVGHFGKGVETYQLDFSEFGGAIFMTKHSFHKVENLYRGRIFTSDVIAPKGITIIKDNNFDQLIEYALKDEGFTKSQSYPPIKASLEESRLLKRIPEIIEKKKLGEIKKVFSIGVSNHTKAQKEYFETFLNLISDDSVVFSMSYTNNKDNVFHFEGEYGFPFLFKALEIIAHNTSLEEFDPVIFLTRYEAHTVPNAIYLKHLGIKKLYLSDYAQNLINPSLINAMKNLYSIKTTTTPAEDLNEMLPG